MHPFSHAATGWLISNNLDKKRDRTLVTVAALVPDIDALPILWNQQLFSEWHHTFGHNIFCGFGVTIVCTLLAKSKLKTAILTLIAFHSHIFEDLLGSGKDWPVLYFWPISKHEFSLFPPFQWELVSWQNYSITIVLLFLMGWIGIHKGRTIAELFSERIDSEIVKVLRNRFSKMK